MKVYGEDGKIELLQTNTPYHMYSHIYEWTKWWKEQEMPILCILYLFHMDISMSHLSPMKYILL